MPKARVLIMTSPAPGPWPAVGLTGILLAGPKLDAGAADVFAEIEVERQTDFGREVDLETPA